jgi:hypothetical protein
MKKKQEQKWTQFEGPVSLVESVQLQLDGKGIEQ